MSWVRYAITGMLSVLTPESTTGLEICVSGNLPHQSGLSSSTSLVICGAFAALPISPGTISEDELCEITM
jgi:galactokinase